MSPTSSKNKVPPCACSNFPGRLATAPVNAPLTWPKSSDSMRLAGMAAQFTSTKGLSALGESRWSARAASSLPVPFSPVTMTRARVPPTVSIRPKHRLDDFGAADDLVSDLDVVLELLHAVREARTIRALRSVR